MAKDLTIGLLNELYGALLTARQSQAVRAYYDDDLSLGEIAENLQVTRQAVRDAIAKGESALLGYEQKLGLYKKLQTVKATLDEIARAVGADNVEVAALIAKAQESL